MKVMGSAGVKPDLTDEGAVSAYKTAGPTQKLYVKIWKVKDKKTGELVEKVCEWSYQ